MFLRAGILVSQMSLSALPLWLFLVSLYYPLQQFITVWLGVVFFTFPVFVLCWVLRIHRSFIVSKNFEEFQPLFFFFFCHSPKSPLITHILGSFLMFCSFIFSPLLNLRPFLLLCLQLLIFSSELSDLWLIPSQILSVSCLEVWFWSFWKGASSLSFISIFMLSSPLFDIIFW